MMNAPMKILILGGTEFLGRYLVHAAEARNHEVTLFNRGKTNPDLFPHLEKLRGDREGSLDALKGRCWDAVIDTCGYVSRKVRDAAKLLADSVATLHVRLQRFSLPGLQRHRDKRNRPRGRAFGGSY